MTSVLKGNFQAAKSVEAKDKPEADDLDSRFEREAMKKLGGSIAYVAKKKIKWAEDENP
ncbi:MAG: hypothetical protein HQL45_00250 [Alphaproteobacteria bacterium]|nr:hypothetical protein [Alphaproteobacteria bacterium]MBF0353779.1 hypothetical protein [Alphaproteobacteria bacterium]